MIVTWKQNLKHLNHDQFNYLRRLCSLSRAIYNSSIYNIRQHYQSSGEYLSYKANWNLLKDTDVYQILGGGIAQQTMRQADYAFKSFFALLKLHKQGKYDLWKIEMPRFKPKGSFNSLIFVDVNRLIDEDGKFLVPVSRILRKEVKTRIYLTVPENIRDKNIHQIQIVPRDKGQRFEVRYIFEIPDEQSDEKLDSSKALAIDLGVNNFATCATSDGNSFIIDGRKIKSINQWYNKEVSRLSAIKDKQHQKKRWTKQMYAKANKRKNQVDYFVYCAAKKIVDYCVDYQIGNLVVGYNEDFQQAPLMKYKNVKQLFCTMPYGQLKNRLEYLCKLNGIKYHTQEESYTSQASFWDKDKIPTWDGRHHDCKFSGKRVKRGLYESSDNRRLNADVNGALNILRKSNVVSLETLYSRGEVITPMRIRLT